MFSNHLSFIIIVVGVTTCAFLSSATATAVPSNMSLAFYGNGINNPPIARVTTVADTNHNSTISNDVEAMYNQTTIVVNGQKLIADLAITHEQQKLGLSVKNSLADDKAMLFVFDKEGRHAFWMKDMKFPIDMIWIDSNQTITHIEHSVPPCEPNMDCHVYLPRVSSLYVLETVSGYSVTHGLHVGTKIIFADQVSGSNMTSERNSNKDNQSSCPHTGTYL